MPYLVTFIIICWLFAYLFLRGPGGSKTLKEMREAEAEMKAATTREDRRAAARRILDVIERDDLTGIVVDDARKAAELTLRS